MAVDLERWQKHDYPIPSKMKAWTLNGAGFENLGVDGEPVEQDVPEPGPRELLLRVDAVGICFSDVKLTRAGNKHPRILDRDLSKDPTRPGHEAAMTVAKVGSHLADRYRVGDRFTIQADVFYKGKSIAFGYVIPGAYSEYVLVGEEILEGDEGSYLLPLPDGMGYVEAALCEPWACVEASYRQFAREEPLAAGRALIIKTAEGDGFSTEGLFDKDADVQQMDSPDGSVPAALADVDPFDDIIILGRPSPELASAASQKLCKKGLLCIAAEQPMDQPASIDVGRIHYELTRVVGTSNNDVVRAYEVNNRTELKHGGQALFIGAAGPMGQMHVQRALEMRNPPAVVVASDPSKHRMEHAMAGWQPLADKAGVKLVAFDPTAHGDEAQQNEALREITGGNGYDDVVVLAPVPKLIAQTSALVAPQAVVNIFAGVPVGTMADLDLSNIYLHGVRYLGTSGSKLLDMRRVMEKAQSGELNTNRSLGAVGGMDQVRKAVEGVAEGTFDGKTVIFPGIDSMPLTPAEDVDETNGEVWSSEAEDRFLSNRLNSL
jgi:threonine dehydrogenase-like Zn-dependent dehydrogenase